MNAFWLGCCVPALIDKPLSSRLFHRRWSDGKGRTLDPNTEVPVTVTNPLGYYVQDVDNWQVDLILGLDLGCKEANKSIL